MRREGSILGTVWHEMIVAAVFCMLLTVTVAPFFSPGVSGSHTKELRIGLLKPVDSLSPFLALNEEAWLFHSLVYDSLQSADEDMNPTSNLATDWWMVPATDSEMVDSGEPYGSVWQYNLTRNAWWHDGNPFTADDVVFTMNVNCQNYSDLWAFQPYSYFMQYAEKIGDFTVRIHYYDRATGEPMPAAYGYMLSVPILPEHKFIESGITAREMGFEWIGLFEGSSPPIVGTGPYMVTSSVKEEWMEGDRLTLVRNPDYHSASDKGKTAHFDKIVMYRFREALALTVAVENGVVDIARLSPAAYRELSARVESGPSMDIALLSTLKCNGDSIVASFSVGGSSWWGMNPNQMICDPAVRKALAQAIDRQPIINDVLCGYAEDGSTMLSPISPWHYEPSPEERVDFDPEAAAETLEDAGYVDTDSDGIREATAGSYAVQAALADVGDELELVIGIPGRNTPEHSIATILGAQWSEIGVSIGGYQEAYLDALCPYGPYDVGVAHRSMDLDPIYPLIWCSQRQWQGWADSRWYNQSFEETFNQSVRALDGEARHLYVDDCQRIHYAEMPQIVLAYPHSTYALRTDVYNESAWGNWSAHPGLTLDNIWGAHPLLFLDFPDEDNGGWTLLHWVLVGALICSIAVPVGVIIYLSRKKPKPPVA